MAMKPYTESRYAVGRRKERNGSITLIPHSLHQRRQLMNVVTSSGDFCTTTPHSYRKLSYTTLTGSEIDQFPNGETIEIVGFDLRNTNWSTKLPVSFDPNVRSEALVDLYSQLRGSEIDLSVDLVQYRQALDMVRLVKRSAHGIARHALSVMPVAERTAGAIRTLNRGNPHFDERRRRVREIDRSLNWLAARRLEYVYGWKPLAGTIVDLAKLATTPPAGEGLLKFRGKGYRKATTPIYETLNGLPILHDIIRYERCVFVCYFSPNSTVLSQLSQISSLNPVSVLYEATPYSMCLDWFVGIGDWLRTLETAYAHSNNFVGGFEMKSFKWVDKVTWKGSKPQPNLSMYSANASQDITYVMYERTRLWSAPFPTRPVVEVNYGLPQFFNTIALAKVGLPKIDRLLDKR